MTADLIPVAEDHLEPLKGHYSPEIILAGLYALAAHGGSSEQAHELLRETYQDAAPAAKTLRTWRSTQYPNRYRHILAEKAPEIEALVEHQLRENLRLTGLAKHKALRSLDEKLDTVNSPTDLAKIAQQLAVTEGVGADKLLVLTGRPNHIAENRNADEILKALEARYPTPVDAEATEVTN